jgi:hypothetical protein
MFPMTFDVLWRLAAEFRNGRNAMDESCKESQSPDVRSQVRRTDRVAFSGIAIRVLAILAAVADLERPELPNIVTAMANSQRERDLEAEQK